jgi:hypothetical protein
MNTVLDEAFEEKQGGEKVAIGMVVCHARLSMARVCYACYIRLETRSITVYKW